MTEIGAFFQDILIWILGALGTIVGVIGKTVRANHERSQNNQRQLQGDPTDPHAQGVLEIAKENGEKIDNLEEKMEDQHEHLLSEFEELARDRRERDAD